jgi:ADP-ribosyl-[dinitrogen reductase] hydrolase
MLKGSCFCKSVNYESHGKILHFINCHCPDCRKLSGATFASFLIVEENGFKIISGEDILVPFESSPGKFRNFCGQCGTHLFRRGEGIVVLRAGTLDDDPGIRPEAEIWTKFKAPWYDIPCNARQIEEGFMKGK